MKLLTGLALALFLVGCGEYIPLQEFKVETVGGQVITFSCPVVGRGRNTLTYMIDRNCRLVK